MHPGHDGPVGAVFLSEGVIHPALIGGDIGCGMGLFATDLPRRKAHPDRWAELPFDLEQPWEGDVRARLAADGLITSQFAESFGTLGDGNHFAELQAVEKVCKASAFSRLPLEKDKLVLLVHSGSRGLGQAVLETYVEAHGASGVEVPSQSATHYLLCHDHAVRWAASNRALIADRFLNLLGARSRRVLDVCHNEIRRALAMDRGRTPVAWDRAGSRGRAGFNLCPPEPEHWLHRKGAVPADRGPVVIPGSRGTFSYVVQACGDGASHLWSLPHGAGRKWNRSDSRTRVRERFRPAQLTQTGLGSRVVCGDRDLLYEEAPPAYKDIEQVIADLVEAGLIEVIATLRPVLTYKNRATRR